MYDMLYFSHGHYLRLLLEGETHERGVLWVCGLLFPQHQELSVESSMLTINICWMNLFTEYLHTYNVADRVGGDKCNEKN